MFSRLYREGNKVQRGQVTCTRSHSLVMLEMKTKDSLSYSVRRFTPVVCETKRLVVKEEKEPSVRVFRKCGE